MVGIESDIRIESVDASLYVKKEKEERNPLGTRRQPSRKRRNNLCNNLSFSLSILPNRRRRRRAAAHYG